MSDNIFISWSKSKSREFAFEVKNLLETLNPHLNIFMSEDNISAGEKVQEKIIQKISECDKVLLCFTRDNKKSPWLLYEAGYACGQNKMVIPLLFDEDPNWHSWIDNPMNIAREININSISFEESFINCFNLCDSVYTRELLSNFIKRIDDIREKYRTSIPAKEGMLDLIRQLSQKEDSILCILTTSERKCAEMAMERLGVLNCFRDIFDSEQIGLNKRSGAIYQWVCEHYDVAQKDTIIFEDAIYAVKAAKETDCYVYGMKDSSNSTVWNEICEMADDIIC